MSSAELNWGQVSDAKSINEKDNLSKLTNYLFDDVVPKEEMYSNLPLFLRRQELSRILFIDHLYRKIVNIPGYIFEFGVRFGTNLALYSNLRGMYEPYNYSRRILGFDTFEGFVGVSENDTEKSGHEWKEGDYSVPKNHMSTLNDILEIHESFSPISHIQKYELIKGDVCETLPRFLVENQEAVVALAYFDMDIYHPTKEALLAIKQRLTKNSILVFDEFGCKNFPGETKAVIEVLGLSNLRFERYQHQPFCVIAHYEP